MVRARLFATVDSGVYRQLETAFQVTCDVAKKNGVKEDDLPAFSHTVEDVLKRGLRKTPPFGKPGE